MARRYFVISDLHLADVENNADGWKDYKHSRFLFDDDFDRALARFVSQATADDELCLVLNGDIVDFDLVTAVPDKPPWRVSRSERKRGLEATEEKSVWKLNRVLDHHPRFVATLAKFVEAGHRLVYVIGNHDADFHFDAVKQAFIDAIVASAEPQRHPAIESQIRFEPWFFYVENEIYASHGQQYDYYNSFRYVLSPIVRNHGKPTIALPMGNLSNRYLMSRMGYFNPHSGDFILNVFRYLGHWLKYYAFSRRSLVWHWFFGSLLVMLRLLRTKRRILADPPDQSMLLANEAARHNMDVNMISALDRLNRVPITDRFYRIVREFWIDRLILGITMTGGTVAVAYSSLPLLAKWMIPLSSFPLLYFIYEWFAHGDTIFSIERENRRCALELANLLRARIITFGHTHVPELFPLKPRTVYINTGTWAPVPASKNTTMLQPGLRNTLTAVFEGETVTATLDSELYQDRFPREAVSL